MKHLTSILNLLAQRLLLPALVAASLFLAANTHAAVLYKDYVVRYDRGWDILCDPYQIQQGDWVLKIFRQKGEIAHDDFREFLGVFQRLNPHVKDIDRIRPGQVVDIPIKKLAQGTLPGQSSGVVSIPFVMLSEPKETIKKHTRSYTIKKGDTVSMLIAKQFGGRFGDATYNQGLKLFQAVNPQIKNINRIYAGQKIYMPDPSIREQTWYGALFDQAGNLVEEVTGETEVATEAPDSPPAAAPAPQMATRPTAPAGTEQSSAEAVSAIGGRLLDKGTYFLPRQQEKDFELDLSRHPMIDLQNGSKVILTTQDRVMDVDMSVIQSYWEEIKVVKVADNASSREVLEAVISAFAGEATENQLAFDDNGVNIRVSAKWIRTEASADGSVPRHTCITPIMSAAQQTHGAIVRYLDQNDIVIKDILVRAPDQTLSPLPPVQQATEAASIDGSSQKALIESFANAMGFNYSPNTTISFPYAGIQVDAMSNLLSFGNGKEILIDFGDLYGDAVTAIKNTGLEILQIDAQTGSVEIIEQLMETAGLSYTASPVAYAADRAAEFNTAITVDGILIPTMSGENRLFTKMQIPELIEDFINDQGIRLVRISGDADK